jgi:nicotinamide mononucleotide (NMN) deamidase PncC
MDPAVRSAIQAVHNSPWRYALSVTGGGTGLVAWLLSVPGGSRGVLEATVPYSQQALAEYLGFIPESYCSAPTTRAMASRARDRAARLAPGEQVAGVSCTAGLRSDRPKRGPHRFHTCVATAERTVTHSLTLTREARERAEEEEVVDRVMLNVLAEVFGVAERVPVPLLPGEEVQVETELARDPLTVFLRDNEALALRMDLDGRLRADAPRPKLLLPGAFNPLHEGHLTLAHVAGRLVGAEPAFELSVSNADKPSLAQEEVRRRMAQFTWRTPVWVTKLPTFEEKSKEFRGAVFVVGADTAARIVACRFYHDSDEQMRVALERVRANGCRFLVAGRVDASGRYLCCENLNLPEGVRDLFTGIPESAFRRDISSTHLRERAAL